LRSAGHVGFINALNDLPEIAPSVFELQPGKGVSASGTVVDTSDWTASIKSQNPHQSDFEADKQLNSEAVIN
jgi:hypothetical protein